MKSVYKATNITWETDGETVDLPAEIILPNYLFENGNDDSIGGYISDQYGWLHNGYNLTKDGYCIEENCQCDNHKI